jgi:hypothetical protein
MEVVPYTATKPLTAYDRCTIEEYPTKTGPADYVLCLGGQIVASIGVEPMQRNFEPMRRQVEGWRAQQVSTAAAKLTIYRAFIFRTFLVRDERPAV